VHGKSVGKMTAIPNVLMYFLKSFNVKQLNDVIPLFSILLDYQ